MQLRPLGGHIIVEVLEKEHKTASGIILPDTGDKERPEQGKVIAVGPGKLLENGSRQVMDVKVGDTVVFKKYAPDEVKLEDKTYLVVNGDDVMAIVE
ncbi:co-chaperone GroES [Candidatus Uhrbacteria bacterium]|nr:co-chaperone GroES [Candidatus Uhrbacteria bacterium]